MISFFKNLFKTKFEYHHFVCVAKKDKSGRIRYKLYIDGIPTKNEMSIAGWYKENIK